MFSISLKQCRGVLAILAAGLIGFAHADGPVSIANLPGGGGNVTLDTDVSEGGGLGQRWGRAGGRTITYHVAAPNTMSALSFGVVQNTQPSLAFDGSVTQATSELMTYQAGFSNPGQGIAVWRGAAFLQLVNQAPFPVNTQFTLRVTTTNGTPIPMAVAFGGPYPLANVLSSQDFKVNLLFEMSDVNNPGVFHPVLDYYDGLPTPQGNPPNTNQGPVMTGVSTGFYYTAVPTGMTIEQHDAHLQSLFDSVTPQINNMNGKINFIRQDWDGRWNGIQQQVQDAQTSINGTLQQQIAPTLSQIQQQVSQLLGQSGGTGNLATKSDIQDLSKTMMILWGLMPCPLTPAECAQVKFIKDLSTQASVDSVKADTAAILIGLNQPAWLPAVQSQLNGILIGLNQPTWLTGVQGTLGTLATHSDVNGILIGLNNALQDKASQASVNALSAKIDALQDAVDNSSSPSLDMVVAPVDTQGSKTARWIVKISRDGELVPAVINGVSTIRTGKGASVLANVMGNTTIVTLAPGLYEVTVSLVKDVSDGSHFVFQASAGGLVGNAMGVPFK